MATIQSPNTVLANSIVDALDLLRPRIAIGQPKEVVFHVGTQINGVPHIGTFIVQASCFKLAQKVREKFGVKVSVEFGALDNAPHDILESDTQGSYQRTYYHALPAHELKQLIEDNYTDYFMKLQGATEVPYRWFTYTEAQASPIFRRRFIDSLKFREQIRWCVAPSSGALRIRIPCPDCKYAEKYAKRTEMVAYDGKSATFSCTCLNHGRYESIITEEGGGAYLDLNTLMRNVVKESSTADDPSKLHVMVKGGDWALSTQPVDWALGAMGYNALQIPVRVFTPQVVTETGAKLSKSLIRDGDASLNEVPEWIMDMSKFRAENPDEYVSIMLWLIDQFMAHPRHMYRSYSYQEVIRILKQK